MNPSGLLVNMTNLILEYNHILLKKIPLPAPNSDIAFFTLKMEAYRHYKALLKQYESYGSQYQYLIRTCDTLLAITDPEKYCVELSKVIKECNDKLKETSTSTCINVLVSWLSKKNMIRVEDIEMDKAMEIFIDMYKYHASCKEDKIHFTRTNETLTQNCKEPFSINAQYVNSLSNLILVINTVIGMLYKVELRDILTHETNMNSACTFDCIIDHSKGNQSMTKEGISVFGIVAGALLCMLFYTMIPKVINMFNEWNITFDINQSKLMTVQIPELQKEQIKEQFQTQLQVQLKAQRDLQEKQQTLLKAQQEQQQELLKKQLNDQLQAQLTQLQLPGASLGRRRRKKSLRKKSVKKL
jgi:hypothetical protein